MTPAHAFAKALLKRAKTDGIDAQTLAQLAALLQPAPWTAPPAVYTELYQRLAQRDALVALRTQVQNQLHALGQQPVFITSVRTHMEQLITTLTAQVSEVEQEIAAALRVDAGWAAAADRLQTITGSGMLTAAWLPATLSATQHNPVIKPFYDGLRTAGKPAKVARCAAARKLLHIAWGVVTKEQVFDPGYTQRMKVPIE